ncbi:LOW QUALITY PROTEIN: disease resistance protein RGA2-like [Momordica charantia]|uniref:LOW QUALITY PROTEIN: disease resistance protein RGA2-like n=1 Tax=Momordica charantia TaxID=3673 RepID=A0A6J1DPI9_MOMCH|nr:LOW QUALITY PROTEIN: disease resistance protein RGA2-like [Momordica charantia]
MADSILFNLAGTLITKLGSYALQELGLLLGVNDELEKLKDTVSAIEAVLLDAEEQPSKSHALKDWLSKLKDVFYEIDDLIDEFEYEALRRQVMTRNRTKTKQVRIFFSKSNQIAFSHKMVGKIKEIRERLKVINDDRTQFHLSERVINNPTVGNALRNIRDPGDYILEEEVIGRNDDKKVIIDLQLSSNTRENIAVVATVGMGGLGKTTLAQSVYNDKMMAKHFELKLWVCISEEFEVKLIIQNIIEYATGEKPESFLQMALLQTKLRKLVDGKRYLLVMDDVWNEDREKWDTLKRFLIGGTKGSKILITTRSHQVANTFDPTSLHPLEELNNNNSWLLFQDRELYQIMEQGGLKTMLSILKLSCNHLPPNLKQCFQYCALFPKDFEIRKDEVIMQGMAQGFIQPNDKDKLVDIGEDYFMELLSKSFFQDVKKDALGDIITCKMHDLMHDIACSENDMNAPTLNKRTRHVSLDLTSGEELEKLPKKLYETRNLRTCFLQYDLYNSIGSDNNFNKIFSSVFYNLLRLRTLGLQLIIDNQSVKLLKCINNLKHLRYLKIEIITYTKFFLNSISGLYNLEVLIVRCTGLKEFPRDIKNLTNLKHLELIGNPNIEFFPNSIIELNNLERLFLRGYNKVKELPQDIQNLIHLQRLDLGRNSNIEFLPDSITELYELKTLILEECTKLKELPRDVQNLINLRHLDLSNTAIEFLPSSITQLKNLETLLLYLCDKLKELPEDTRNLINLRHLSICGCKALTHMPKGLGELTHLQRLDVFMLGKDNNGGGLRELDGLNKLSGLLKIEGLQFCSTVDLQTNAKFLQRKSGLQYLQLEWNDDSFNEPTIGASDYDYERVLECLPPHSNLQQICIRGYKGVKLCNWLSSTSYSFGGMIHMEFSSCERLRHLPQFDLFPNLKVLCLHDLPSIEYIVGNHNYPCSSTFFPSLETFIISDMPNLKRWWRKGQTSTKSAQNRVLFPVVFPCLSELIIWKCPLLASVTCDAPMKSLEINDEFDVVSWKSFQSLSILLISSVSQWEFLSNCLQHVTTLQQLDTKDCPNLTSLPESIGNLTSLSKLLLVHCPDLISLPESIGNTSLSKLRISNCPDLSSLPESMGNLTSLTELEISCCPKITSLPEGIRHLYCLQSLKIICSPILLNERCNEETEEDWPKIPNVNIY